MDENDRVINLTEYCTKTWVQMKMPLQKSETFGIDLNGISIEEDLQTSSGSILEKGFKS